MNQLKQLVKRIPLVRGLALRGYVRFLKLRKRYGNPNEIPTWLRKYVPEGEATVVQIGSNDGKTGDPIHTLLKRRPKWRALFVEPVPFLFERLRENYDDDPRYIFENVAINDGSEATFYSVREEAKDEFESLPHWYDQLNSFDRNHILKHLDGKLEPYIVETTMQGARLMDLLERHRLGRVDLLHIDTEGYDWKVLSQLNLRTHKPAVLLFEHKHLGDEERVAAAEFVLDDYYLFKFRSDFLAIRQDVIERRDLGRIGDRLVTRAVQA